MDKTAPTHLWKFLGTSRNQPYEPFPAQAEILTTVKFPWPGKIDGVPYPRVFCINCGRQFGKTTVAEVLLWHALVMPEDQFGPPVVRVTADTEEHGRKIWDKFIDHATNTDLANLVQSYSRERERVTLHNGANAQLMSANNPQALSGDTVSVWLVDEAQFFSQAAYTNMSPSVVMRNGVIVLFGVSQGSGPFKDVCWRGTQENRKNFPEYLKLRYPSWTNPYMPPDTIEKDRRDMDPIEFRQLYGAEWVDEANKVFSDVREVVDINLVPKVSELKYGWTKPPLIGSPYYAGLDVARFRDFTVFMIFDRYGNLVAWDRFNAMPWEDQKKRLVKLSGIYQHPKVMVDSTALGGSMILEDLQKTPMRVVGYEINSNPAKKNLVDSLVLAIGQRRLRIPFIQELISELELYERKLSKSENSSVTTYSAPSGKHDDMVMAMALASLVVPKTAIHLPTDNEMREVGIWESL